MVILNCRRMISSGGKELYWDLRSCRPSAGPSSKERKESRTNAKHSRLNRVLNGHKVFGRLSWPICSISKCTYIYSFQVDRHSSFVQQDGSYKKGFPLLGRHKRRVYRHLSSFLFLFHHDLFSNRVTYLKFQTIFFISNLLSSMCWFLVDRGSDWSSLEAETICRVPFLFLHNIKIF